MNMFLRTAGFAIAVLVIAGCNRSNNLLEGRVEETVGTHDVVVTDCYRTRVPPVRLEDTSQGERSYRFTPCRDADVLIRGDHLWVNGRSYGPIGTNDGIVVDHGIVSIEKLASGTSR